MSRRFTDDERRRINQDLDRAARQIMGPRGVRKTTIDELAHTAGIAKGSFYRFYSGKEALAFRLVAQWERDFHRGIERRFRRSAPHGVHETAMVLQAVFLEDFPRSVAETGMYGLFDPEEIAYLQRRADPEHLQIMEEQDLRLFEKLESLLAEAGLRPAVEKNVIIAGLRVLFEGAQAVLRNNPSGPLQPTDYQEGFARLLEGFLATTFAEHAPA